MILSKEQLEILSECILSKMKEISGVKPITDELSKAIQSELELLRKLNSIVCDELNILQAEKVNND